MNAVASCKKARDSYKTKADAVTSGLKKAQTDSDAMAGQIRQIGAGYQKAAISMDHEEIVDDLVDLIDTL